ncbi:MAG: acyl-phosphate glycerol 3-phosphate acyltransferase [Sulfuricurvum sp. PC08-66]|nr:MAG: acyl-phosphate glycerol 3-phosphate acyltransferase [Sulfuricurvum sp. PC08-66]
MRSFHFTLFQVTLFAITESILVYLFRKNLTTVDKIRAFFTHKIVQATGATVVVKGTLESDTHLIIANHQSNLDIFVLEDIIGPDVRFVGRKGIMDKWPTSTVVNTVGHITIDLEDKRSIIHLIKEVKAKKGLFPVVIFPEGTRQRTGRIETFEAGSKLVAEKLELKTQPCVIKNLLNVYNEKNKHTQAGIIEVEFLPPVSLTEGWYEATHDAMQKCFTAYSA